MSITGMSGTGRIRLFNDFCGPEIPIANAVAYGTTAGGCNYYLGDFRLGGSLHDTDSGAAIVASKANGVIRLTSSATADGDGIWIGSDLCFTPASNGPLILEARCEMAALTARNVFVGFLGTFVDEIAEIITSTTATCTKVGNAVGFLFDSQLTNQGTASTAYWVMPYMISTTTSQTSTDIEATQVAVAGEMDVLRIEVYPDGSARWFINGKLEQSVGAALAADTTTALAGGAGVWSTTTTVGSLDIDYLLVEANRDWTR